jgi:hypothetical protein
MANVKLIKLLTGEDLLAEVIEQKEGFEQDNVIQVKNPVRIIIQNDRAGFIKWAELSPDTEMELDRFHVVAVLNAHKQLVDQYLNLHGKIVPATVSSLIIP